MRALIQRVNRASVAIGQKVAGSCGKGLLIFVGVMDGDKEETVNRLVKKVYNLRIFEDENGKTNLSSKDVDGEFLVISQFTLCADCRHGNRPSFIRSAPADKATWLYEYFVKQLSEISGKAVATGEFGADMQVSLVNNGPFTIMLDTDNL